MGSWLSDREQRLVAGAETASAATPIPTQIVSNGEYLPPPQSETQKRVERRIFELADENSKRLGLNRRQFLQTGCGMAAAFLAMNDIYGGDVFQVATAEAREPELARPAPRVWPDSSSSTCRPISCATTSTNEGALAARQVRRRALEPEAEGDRLLTLARYKFQNYVKEIYYDSDTSMALLSGAPFDDPNWWFLSNEQIVAHARAAQRLRGLAPPAGTHHHHAQAARLDGRGRQGDRESTSPIRGRPTPSAIRWFGLEISRGGSTTSR